MDTVYYDGGMNGDDVLTAIVVVSRTTPASRSWGDGIQRCLMGCVHF